MTKVVIAMSGGVDSSVAAALLKQQGYQVIGMMLRLWSEPGFENHNRCCSPDDMAMARRVAAQLDIPFYVIDAKSIFFDTVINDFTNGYTKGITPNPCLICNKRIRWDFLLNHAFTIGADFLATGHYARIRTKNPENQPRAKGHIELLKAKDPSKDQSYVLHVLDQEQLAHAMFPLGDYTKEQVRKMAISLGLPVAQRSDSQDLCFIGNGDYRDFLVRNVPDVETPGDIKSVDNEILGQHKGLAFFTIGQRKGLGIVTSRPYYVIRKDITNNALIVGPSEQLGRDELTTSDGNWISGNAPKSPINSSIKTRYKAPEVEGVITPLGANGTHIKFSKPLRDITPGQAAVFYEGEVCLGGGIIN
jgi:tRNA-specific 2-thiouridylase